MPTSDNESGGIAALGALLGYVGAEAATTAPFEHLFWPQRHLSNASWQSLIAAAALLPMGGPLHKAALATFDRLHQHGIFKGVQRGHMLGTAFLPDPGWTYVQHQDGARGEPKALRNCVWATAMGLLHYVGDPADPAPAATDEYKRGTSSESDRSMQRSEKGFSNIPAAAPRARISTFHMTFSPATDSDRSNPRIPFVREDYQTPGLRVLMTLVAAEFTSIVFAVAITAIWRTFWAVLWIVPLLLRLISVAFTLNREALAANPLDAAEDTADFEVFCPPSSGDFMILTGPPRIVQQFTRHYGHPVRNRLREVAQLVLAVGLGAVFPVGLVASSLFMPHHLQYVWFGYQIVLVTGLHCARYSRHARLSSTEAAIADAFRARLDGAAPARSSILFGHHLDGAETLRVDLVVSCHGKHAEGKKAAQDILCRSNPEKS